MKMEVDSVLVTGANRGIGLEFVRQLVNLPKPPKYVFATYRSEGTIKDLQAVKESSKNSAVILIKLDVTKTEEITAARKIIEQHVGDNGLNLLINNAGVAKYVPFPTLTPEVMQFHFTTNTVGPVMIFQEMLPLLEKAASRKSGITGMSFSKAAVLNLTSMAGSITRTGKEFTMDLAVPAYKTSKAALNMVMRVVAANVKEKEILVILMCPGWVRTDMGTEKGELSTEESISAMLKTFPKLNETHHGTYIDRLGNPYPF